MATKTRYKSNPLNDNSCFRLVVKFYARSGLPYGEQKEVEHFFLKNQIIPWPQLTEKFTGISIDKLFTSVSSSQVKDWVRRAAISDPSYKSPDFFSYYSISWKNNIRVKSLVRMLKSCEQVELVYYQHGPVNPPAIMEEKPRMLTQNYFKPAPDGLDFNYASKLPGGNGHGNVRLIDIEQGWILDHEDIQANTLDCTGINSPHHADHGAAVLGILTMKGNAIKGIVPQVKVYVISQWRGNGEPNTADAVMAAIHHLKYGDVLLLEVQTSLSNPPDKLWPVEAEDAVWEAIRLATALGIIVIEAAGNGSLSLWTGNDLDQLALRNKRVLNPDDKAFRDSGAIMVAAEDSTMLHRRVFSSNYGKRINCYALGQGVWTAGSYPQSSNGALDNYSRNFGGTSSAAAIIAGAAIAIQSIYEKKFSKRIGPLEMRALLSSERNCTPSCNGLKKDKIGGMPDLRKILDSICKL